MVLVVISYVLSLKVLGLELERAERYYLQGIEAAQSESGWWDRCAKHVNHWMSAAAFALGLVLTTFFVSTNLRGATMAEKKVVQGFAQDGITGMTLQKVHPTGGDLQKGLTGMPMQSVTPSAPASPAPAQQPQGSANPTSSK
ncbi:hypothetical protein FQZ97_980890 [compost metagenome]